MKGVHIWTQSTYGGYALKGEKCQKWGLYDVVVKAWDEHLDKHPEDAVTKKPIGHREADRSSVRPTKIYRKGVRAFQIAELTPYSESMVHESLKRIKLIEVNQIATCGNCSCAPTIHSAVPAVQQFFAVLENWHQLMQKRL